MRGGVSAPDSGSAAVPKPQRAPRFRTAAACHGTRPGQACRRAARRPGARRRRLWAGRSLARRVSGAVSLPGPGSRSRPAGARPLRLRLALATASQPEGRSGSGLDFSKRVQQTLTVNHRTKNQHSPVPALHSAMLATLYRRRAVGYSATQCESHLPLQGLSFQTRMIEPAASYDLQGRANQAWQ